MKVLVVLCAVVACCLAKPGGYAYSVSSVVSAPVAYAAAGPAVVAGPVAYAAPAVAYAAPLAVKSVVAAPAVVAAPVAYAAPAVPAPLAYAPHVAYAAPAVKAVAAPAPVVVAAAPVVAGLKTQYHAQDELGQASYGHSEPGQVHNAVQDAHGNKIGSFSYVNPDGHVLRTDYVADGAGYRVASNGVPVATYGHYRRRRSLLVQTPASTQPLVYSAPIAYPYSAPLAYASPVAPVPYAVPAPVAYSAHAVVAAVPAVRPATLTTVVNNPGHAVSYRVH